MVERGIEMKQEPTSQIPLSSDTPKPLSCLGQPLGRGAEELEGPGHVQVRGRLPLLPAGVFAGAVLPAGAVHRAAHHHAAARIRLGLACFGVWCLVLFGMKRG